MDTVMRGQWPVIHSDGKSVPDDFYIKDGVVSCTPLVQDVAKKHRLHGQTFNFSDKTPVSVVETLECITWLMDPNLKPIIDNKGNKKIREQYLSSAKANKLLKWKPLVTLDEGLKRTIASYSDFIGK